MAKILPPNTGVVLPRERSGLVARKFKIEPTKLVLNRPPKELIAKTKRLLPDFKGIEKLLDKDPQEIFSKINPGLKGINPNSINPETKNAMNSFIESARASLVKINSPGFSGGFTADEEKMLCSIIFPFARPALLVQNNDYIPPPEESEWYEILKQNRKKIDKSLKSVGRIEYVRGEEEWNMATGFLVADNVMMTARHVADYFCDQKGTEWTFDTGVESRIDYCAEKGNNGPDSPREFKIKEILKIFDEPTDLALFRITKSSSKHRKHPKPLALASKMPAEVKDRNVYAVGYPVYDIEREPDKNLRFVFGNDWGVKRLQPGKITSVKDGILCHDCSVVGGNSGSCIIDIDLNQVIGLHIQNGDDFNEAVALPDLKKDLEAIGVKFA